MNNEMDVAVRDQVNSAMAEQNERLRAEVAYLLPRACQASRIDFIGERDTGTSSNAMVREALGGKPVSRDEYPRDGDDLAACELAYQRAPGHLRERMTRTLEKYRAAVAAAWGNV